MIPSGLKAAINGTGVILHTGLGRSPLSDVASRAVIEVSQGYCTLEINTSSGERGSRHDLVSDLLCELTGAESAIVVNNNAAALMLILNSLAFDREVIISRSELVEIGGAFRVPDVMKAGGVKLVGVGSTNHIVLADYRAAVNKNTGLLMSVNQSNFKIGGYNKSVPLDSLVSLGKEKKVPVIYDQGSGVLVDLTNYGLECGNTIQESLSCGVDVVCFSGDKLLGGPQAGLIVGQRKLLDIMQTNPMMRAFRADKMVYAALRATMEMFRHPEELYLKHTLMGKIAVTSEELKSRAEFLSEQLRQRFSERVKVSVAKSYAEIGGGALPGQKLPSYSISLSACTKTNRDLAKRFRVNDPPIFGRLSGDCFMLDLRTLDECDFPAIERAVDSIVKWIDEKGGAEEKDNFLAIN